MEALCGRGIAQQDGFVRMADLALHARQMVPRRTADRQHPIFNFDQADNFTVAYYAGGDEQPKALPFAEESVEIEPEPGQFNQRGQTVWGNQLNIAGDAYGPVVAGNVDQIGDRYETHVHTHEAPPPPPFTWIWPTWRSDTCRASPLTVTLSPWPTTVPPTWRRNGTPACHRSTWIWIPPMNPH